MYHTIRLLTFPAKVSCTTPPLSYHDLHCVKIVSERIATPEYIEQFFSFFVMILISLVLLIMLLLQGSVPAIILKSLTPSEITGLVNRFDTIYNMLKVTFKL